jgi:hypothetical protein
MRYYNEVEVELQVYKNLTLFKRGNKDDPKREGDMLFDRITVRSHFKSKIRKGRRKGKGKGRNQESTIKLIN